MPHEDPDGVCQATHEIGRLDPAHAAGAFVRHAEGKHAKRQQAEVDEAPDAEHPAGGRKPGGIEGADFARVDPVDGRDVGGGIDGDHDYRREQSQVLAHVISLV